MGYNDIDITTIKGDVVDGSLWKIKGGITTDLDIDVDLTSLANAVCLGDASTDGTDFEREADSNDVFVWSGRKVRTVYSNFAHNITIRLANSTDTDVLETLVGEDNVSITTGGAKKVEFKAETPPVDGYVISGRTLDGRKALAVINKGQPDPNMSWTWNQEDIVVYEVPLSCLTNNDNRAFYLLIEEPEAPVVP